MEIQIVAFGIAKDILGNRKITVTLPQQSSVHDLRQLLVDRHPSFAKLNSLRFAVKEEYVEDSVSLKNNDEVVIIPPVSGG